MGQTSESTQYFEWYIPATHEDGWDTEDKVNGMLKDIDSLFGAALAWEESGGNKEIIGVKVKEFIFGSSVTSIATWGDNDPIQLIFTSDVENDPPIFGVVKVAPDIAFFLNKDLSMGGKSIFNVTIPGTLHPAFAIDMNEVSPVFGGGVLYGGITSGRNLVLAPNLESAETNVTSVGLFTPATIDLRIYPAPGPAANDLVLSATELATSGDLLVGGNLNTHTIPLGTGTLAVFQGIPTLGQLLSWNVGGYWEPVTGGGGGNATIHKEFTPPLATYTLPNNFISGSLIVYKNGLAQPPSNITEIAPNQFSFVAGNPVITDTVSASYIPV